MDGKKAPGRFTLQFRVNDPKQRMVIDILNQQGRSKAQFLTNAVLHYINCSETPEYQIQIPALTMEDVEGMVLEILKKRTEPPPPIKRGTMRPEPSGVNEYVTNLDTGRILDDEDLTAIASSLAAFRTE